jgi:SPX domain protein involved in polyphosphate accumulation
VRETKDLEEEEEEEEKEFEGLNEDEELMTMEQLESMLRCMYRWTTWQLTTQEANRANMRKELTTQLSQIQSISSKHHRILP